MRLLNDASHKLQLYAAHHLICYLKERLISRVFDIVAENERCSSAVVLMNYEIKLEPIFFKKVIVEYFGRKRISWYGGVVTYKVPSEARDGNEVGIEEGKDIFPFYIDHIVDGDTMLDSIAVCSTVEPVLVQVRVDRSSRCGRSVAPFG